MSRFLIRKVPSGVKFDLTAANGEVVASSEVYSSAAACRRGIEGVRRAAPVCGTEDLTDSGSPALSNPKFELYTDKTGNYRFRLKAKNGKIIAVSEDYATKNGCLSGIQSVIKNAPEAEIMEDISWTSKQKQKK